MKTLKKWYKENTNKHLSSMFDYQIKLAKERNIAKKQAVVPQIFQNENGIMYVQ